MVNHSSKDFRWRKITPKLNNCSSQGDEECGTWEKEANLVEAAYSRWPWILVLQAMSLFMHSYVYIACNYVFLYDYLQCLVIRQMDLGLQSQKMADCKKKMNSIICESTIITGEKYMKGYVQLVHCYYSIDHSDQTPLIHLVWQSYAIIVDNTVLKWSKILYAWKYIEPSASKVEYKNRAPYELS